MAGDELSAIYLAFADQECGVPLASEQPPEALVCVHDSCFLRHLSPEDQRRYAHELIPAIASTRELARHDLHGEWIEWTAGD